MTKPNMFQEAAVEASNRQEAEAQQEQPQAEGAPTGAQDAPPAWLASYQTGILESVGKLIDQKLSSASAAPKGNAQASEPSVDEIVNRQLSFERGISSFGEAAQQKLRSLYSKEKPADVDAWINDYASSFGLAKGKPPQSAPQYAGVPVTNGGVPRNDVSIANRRKPLHEMTSDEIDAFRRESAEKNAKGNPFERRMFEDYGGQKIQLPKTR